ncbi:MAG: DsrE family protein [Candidatus Helarchaeota archaeon]
MSKVTKVLLLLKEMIYESTSPMEIIRFSKYYRQHKGLDVTVVLWGSMGILLAKKNKRHRMNYEQEVKECIELGIKFICCDMGAMIIGLDESELMEGVKLVPSYKVADLLLEYQEEGQLIFSL